MAIFKQQNESNKNPLSSDLNKANNQDDKICKQLLSKKKIREVKINFIE